MYEDSKVLMGTVVRCQVGLTDGGGGTSGIGSIFVEMMEALPVTAAFLSTQMRLGRRESRWRCAIKVSRRRQNTCVCE